MCEKIVAPGGTIANIGVHGTKVDLHLEKLWDRNITITTRLVDTVSTPMLLNSLRSHKIDPKLLITHRFKLDHILDAYETFAHAANTKALKVIIEALGTDRGDAASHAAGPLQIGPSKRKKRHVPALRRGWRL